MPCWRKLLLHESGLKQTSAGNNSVYVAHMQNNTQNHVLLSTRDFYQLAGISPCINLVGVKQKHPYSATMPMWVGCWILLCHERRMGGDRRRDRGKRKRMMNYGSMCVCAFKSPQARAECWESRPVPFSWPLRGGLLPSASMMENGDGTSE